MKHQLQTIREFVESAHEGEWASYVDRDAALTALSELEAMAGEPVLFIHPSTFNMDNAHVGAWKPGHELEGYIPLFAAPVAQQPQYPLPDDLYPNSKDWAAGTYAERVEWLHRMYESQKELVAEYERQFDAMQTKQAEAVPSDVVRDAERYRAINTPEVADFLAAVHNEALHQRERWGSDHDAGKTDADWFWLLGYLGGKAMHAQTDEKRLHHIITTAAACLNWHAARVGMWTAMRPGIDAAAQGAKA